MLSQTVLVSLLVALAEARFGQEQVPIAAISALSSFGQSGQAATLAGGSIQFLLAAANPCGKLTQADNIVKELGTDPQVIAAARGLVAAEQNFNPFVVSVPNICSDPTLPATAELRGVVPLIDPAVTGSDAENANSAKSTTTPFNADGLSVADVMVAQGFSNFTTTDAAGTKGTPSGAGAAAGGAAAGGAAAGGASASNSSAVVSAPAVGNVAAAASCGGTTLVTVTMAATSSAAVAAATSASVSSAAAAASSGSAASAGSASASGVQASTISGLDFGLCVPTMKFEAGLDGRKATEFTFQAIDPLVNKGQEEALNPAIIMNRICDQLTNVCNANAAAKSACLAAKTSVAPNKDVSTADNWNTVLGFAGTNTNPDNAPQAGLVGHT
ncbi:hypothetical protein CJF32_00002632 [Rutstroemia sp. NJR-2017a WRK4]|nr:hypothetical protein CJF32_00006331 [Rutstroemia sp. NJR-2017a WRK4]PQE11805.1 hypothetical protein CJF32_00002632 [Rutstroemia sp. NJR-2017a WRK4]